jgi:hypothetical protein
VPQAVPAVTDGPAMTVTSVLGTVAALVTALVPLSPAQSAAAVSAATAAGTVIAALHARSIDTAVVAGACGVVLENLAIFGLKLSPDQVSALSAGAAVALGALMHLLGRRSGHRPVTPPPVPVSAVAGSPVPGNLPQQHPQPYGRPYRTGEEPGVPGT